MRLMQRRDTAVVALLGAALLLGSPGSGNAEPGKGKGHGKGWRERGEKRVERKVERSRGNGKVFRDVERRANERGSSVKRSSPGRIEGRSGTSSARRSEDRVVKTPRSSGWRSEGRVVRSREVNRDYAYRAPTRTRVQTSYQAPRWSGGRYYTGSRYHTVYRGYPVYREYVSYRYAPAYAPAYGWRYYCAPRYVYDTHVVYVQPVRFFVAADFMIGGVGISARYVDPGPVYGCNFCDARFGTYHAYETHVEHACGHIPHGYRVYADDWHDEVWQDGHDDDYYEDDGYYEE
ncbi:MAG TPA: hypothetical protein VFV24_07505 [Candidatus Eisenbacteria bacterium]|nr:hypothetical protein [Candidatus Eisenbacteria bacterium]